MPAYDNVIDGLRQKLAEQESNVGRTKTAINHLLAIQGRSPLYPEMEGVKTGEIGPIPHDHWYGRPIASCITEYLTTRRTAGLGAATMDELYESLCQGGIQFEGTSYEMKLGEISMVIGNNPQIFHRLPSGAIGLLKWYPGVSTKKRGNRRIQQDVTQEFDADEAGEFLAREKSCNLSTETGHQEHQEK